MRDTPEPADLDSAFRRYFTLTPALDDKLRRETYRIRHEVYCRDLGWEPLRPTGEETDDYDSHSTPCLLRTADSGSRVGCLRLVQCPADDPARVLPIERTCAGRWQRAMADNMQCDRRQLAEVSRLAVVRQFRRRKGEQDKPIALDTTDISDSGHQRFPFIPVGLYLAAFAMADQLGITQLLVLTEPRLARHLARIGFDIRPLGAPVEHRGLRVPSVMDTRRTIDNLHPLLAGMWQHIRQGVAAAYANEKLVAGTTPCWRPQKPAAPPPQAPGLY